MSAPMSATTSSIFKAPYTGAFFGFYFIQLRISWPDPYSLPAELNKAESNHRIRYSPETGNICAQDIIMWLAEFLCRFAAVTVNVVHDFMQSFFTVFKTTAMGGIVLHFQG